MTPRGVGARMLDALGALPDDGAVTLRVATLRAVLHIGCAPRVAAVGRRGAGKSALVNALADAPLARTGDVADATLDARVLTPPGIVWLDTPGLRAGGRAGRLDHVIAEVRAFAPTHVAFLVSATEVDAAIDADLDDLAAVLAALSRRPALVAVATRVDELEPPDVYEAPFDDAEKRANIVKATRKLHGHLLRRGLHPSRVLPLCALAAWDEPHPTHDARWNLSTLRHVLATPALDDAKELDLLVRGLCEALVHHAAEEASVAAMRPRARGLLETIHARLLRQLDEVLQAFCGARAVALPDAVGALARPGLAGEALRSVLDGLGATRASGVVAAARVRALGAAVLTLEATQPSPEVLAWVRARRQ